MVANAFRLNACLRLDLSAEEREGLSKSRKCLSAECVFTIFVTHVDVTAHENEVANAFRLNACLRSLCEAAKVAVRKAMSQMPFG